MVSNYFQLVSANKSAQAWVETVIYTLIGLSIISLLLAIVLPQINQQKDRIILEQSSGILLGLNDQINWIIDKGPSNVVESGELSIRKGELTIDGSLDILKFKTDSEYLYSEPGQTIKIHDIYALTNKTGKKYIVTLYINYSGRMNLTWNGLDEKKTLQQSSVPYFLMLSNNGNTNSLVNIDFRIK